MTNTYPTSPGTLYFVNFTKEELTKYETGYLIQLSSDLSKQLSMQQGDGARDQQTSNNIKLVDLEIGRRAKVNSAIQTSRSPGEDDWHKPFAPWHGVYGENNTSYSGCDITPVVYARNRLFVLGNVHTLTYSVHREKGQVRTLGRIYNKGVTRGQVTIAGSMIFTVFDRAALAEIIDLYGYENRTDYNPTADGANMRTPLIHQIPPFDVVITFMNEYGSMSYMRIFGIEIMDEGQTMSIEDLQTENIMQYMARDIDLMVPSGKKSGRTIQFEKGIFTEGRLNLVGADAKMRADFRGMAAYKSAIAFLSGLNQTLQASTDENDIRLRNHIPHAVVVLQTGGVWPSMADDVKAQLIKKGLWNSLGGPNPKTMTQDELKVYNSAGMQADFLYGLSYYEKRMSTEQPQIADVYGRSFGNDNLTTDVAQRL